MRRDLFLGDARRLGARLAPDPEGAAKAVRARAALGRPSSSRRPPRLVVSLTALAAAAVVGAALVAAVNPLRDRPVTSPNQSAGAVPVVAAERVSLAGDVPTCSARAVSIETDLDRLNYMTGETVRVSLVLRNLSRFACAAPVDRCASRLELDALAPEASHTVPLLGACPGSSPGRFARVPVEAGRTARLIFSWVAARPGRYEITGAWAGFSLDGLALSAADQSAPGYLVVTLPRHLVVG